jgi:hypothetical protein
MKVALNDKLIKRNSKIGQYTSIAGILVLFAGLYITFFQQAYFSWSFLALAVGFILGQIGMFYGNRFGRSPRPDERISAELKGMDNKHTLYHYLTPINHLLVGPGGIWSLVPYFQGGTITYDANKERYRQKGGNFYMKLFGQENLGRPDMEGQSTREDTTKFIQKLLEKTNIPPVNVILIFTNEKTEVQVDGAPFTTLHISKVKDYLRKRAKDPAISMEDIAKIQASLPRPD